VTSSGAIDHGRFPPGTILGGRYRIVGRLGKGGMGEVFRADDLKLGQPVALKFLPPEVDRDPARLTQLHSEVRMARQVSHPNVCRVYDIDEIEGHTFLSMEYVDGEDLASLLRRIGRFNEERGIEIARQICAGLAAAHERGVVHRDFKPANVMLDGTGHVRIADFGLAGLSGEALRAGTPAYMAPEQLAGHDVTARSDIYALGLVLYEIFTGRRALEGDNLAELVRRREQAEILPPSAITRELSPEVDRAIMRCLSADPAARPASALSVSAALPGGDPLAAALAAGETPSPEMVAAAGESVGLSRRTGVALLAFVIVAVLAVAGLSSRSHLAGRVAFDKSADVLEERAREILVAAGYPPRGTDAARGVAMSGEYVTWLGARESSASRWEVLKEGHGPVLRFWYRTSPRALIPTSPSWYPLINDPPLALSGMATVIVDDKGRLLEFVTMPPQVDSVEGASPPVDWAPLFQAAGLPLQDFTATVPQWTPRIFADARTAWEGPMPGAPDARIRVEAASYRGRPVSFHIVWPWTVPSRMEQTASSALLRALSLAGALLIAALLAGAIALARFNLKSGRADRRGATRLALFLIGVWIASWALGARHSLSVDTEADRFFFALAITLLNVGFTWLFYLGLEPFVRRFCPEMLIGWTRMLRAQYRDPVVGRDLLVGCALGVFLFAVAAAGSFVTELAAGVPAQPKVSGVMYLLGAQHSISMLLRVVPNALQGAMIGTFLYVVLLALVRRRSVAIGMVIALFGAVVVAEGGDGELWMSIIFALLLAGPMMFVFVRFGLLALAAALAANQALQLAPLTLDLTMPHALASSMAIVAVCAAAAYAFHISGAGQNLFRRLLPTG
jgi:serine/threonine-protein kinase